MYEKQVDLLLSSLGQSHLKKGWNELDALSQEDFLHSLAFLSPSLLSMQRSKNSYDSLDEYSDWNTCSFSVSTETVCNGKDLLAQGKMACLILAGGQGSRLGGASPKGIVGVSVIENKSCFQLFFERALYAGIRCKRKLLLAVMTSPSNHKETVEFLLAHNFFGLDEDQVSFFMQEEMPFLSFEGDWFLESPGKIAKGPDGNGHCLHLFYKSGLWDRFKKEGVEYLQVIPVDNPLADPFDEGFLGFHSLEKSDIAIKSVRREEAEEKVGVLASVRGDLRVIEYSERKDKRQFSFVNTALFCFTMTFIQALVEEKKELPWHLALKKGREDSLSANREFWKFEKFLFDVFPYAKKIAVLVALREDCFSPLKNGSGRNSRETVQKALLERDRRFYRTLKGEEPPLKIFELSPSFYYPKEGDLAAWKKADFPRLEYIEPEFL